MTPSVLTARNANGRPGEGKWWREESDARLDAGDLVPAGRAPVVGSARSRPRRDVLQAQSRPERPSDSFGGGLVGAAARERQEVRGRGQEQTSRRRRGHSSNSAAQSRTMTTFERNDRAVLVVLDGVDEVLLREDKHTKKL